jgi:uncharacterized protein YecT (DUF1311 family)
MTRDATCRASLRAVAATLALWPVLVLAQPAAAERPAPSLPERMRTLDEGLQQEQAELLQRVGSAARDRGRLSGTLKMQQAAWLQYRDASCALAGAVGSPEGATSSPRMLQCQAEWTEAQRMRVWAALDCIGQLPPAERAAQLDRCLQALSASPRP